MNPLGRYGRAAAVFLLLAFGLSYAAFALGAVTRGAALSGQPVSSVLASFGPAFAAVITVLLFRWDWHCLGTRAGEARFYLFAGGFPFLAYPLFFGVLCVAGVMVPGGGGPLPGVLVPGLVMMLFLALGEETGWRGFLVPLTARMTGGFVTTALVTGVVWAAWHVPFLLSRFRSDEEPWLSAGSFAIGVVGTAFLYTWLRLSSGSLYPCVLLHGLSDWVGSFLIPAYLVPVLSPGAFSPVSVAGPAIDALFAVAVACICVIPGRKLACFTRGP